AGRSLEALQPDRRRRANGVGPVSEHPAEDVDGAVLVRLAERECRTGAHAGVIGPHHLREGLHALGIRRRARRNEHARDRQERSQSARTRARREWAQREAPSAIDASAHRRSKRITHSGYAPGLTIVTRGIFTRTL